VRGARERQASRRGDDFRVLARKKKREGGKDIVEREASLCIHVRELEAASLEEEKKGGKKEREKAEPKARRASEKEG